MELQNFTSLLEIFATFSLAYIIIDEITQSFVGLVSEKLLKKYKLVKKPLEELKIELTGEVITLENLPQIEGVKENPFFKADYNYTIQVAKGTQAKLERTLQEASNEIKGNHTTHMFVYLNCYLFLYCLVLLFAAGFYLPNEEKYVNFNISIDTSLLLFFMASLTYIMICWRMETLKERTPKAKGALRKFMESHNGYLVAVILIILLCISCCCGTQFFEWHFEFLKKNEIHNGLILSLISLPMVNFLIYIIKANNRAKSILTSLKARHHFFLNDYKSELEQVKQFIVACTYKGPQGGTPTIQQEI